MSKRVALLAAGAVLTVGGGLLAAGAGTVIAAIGTDGTMSSGPTTVRSSTRALVTDQGDIDARGADVLADPSVEIAVSRSDKPVFVGIGPADEVDRYLAGAAVETVTDFDVRPFELTTTVREGSARPGTPAKQTFWVAQSDGSSFADMSWEVRDGSYRVVVMNADGSPGIDVDGEFGLHVPRVIDIAAAIVAAGVLLIAVGAVLVVTGLRTRPVAVPAEATSSHVAAPL